MYRIAVIDDRDDEIRILKQRLKPEFLVKKMELYSELNDIVAELMNLEIDAIIVDFELSGTNPEIHFKGDKVVDEIRVLKKLFPVTILTAFSEQAENAKIDPDIVYDKESVLSKPDVFKRKLSHKIENYQNMIEKYREELVSLTDKDKLTLEEEERILELDRVLEDELDSRSGLPQSLKTISNYNKLEELIKLSKTIIERIDKDEN